MTDGTKRRWRHAALGAIAIVLLGLSPAAAAPVGLDPLIATAGLMPLRPVTARAFSLEGLDGTRVSLADVRGRPSLLYFWGTW